MEPVGVDYHVNRMESEMHSEVMPAKEMIFKSRFLDMFHFEMTIE